MELKHHKKDRLFDAFLLSLSSKKSLNLDNDIKNRIKILIIIAIIQASLILFYNIYGSYSLFNFLTLYPADFFNPEKISKFSYYQLGLNILIIPFLYFYNIYTKRLLKILRLIFGVLSLLCLFLTTNGISFLFFYTLISVNKILNSIVET